jgi:nucleoside-diphosphate-sugar epimerase
MRVLITGALGYIGPAVIANLRKRFPESELIGLDAGFFVNCLTTRGGAPEIKLDAQRFMDVRDVSIDDLRGVDVVVHLAAISNDPLGSRFADATDAINRVASLKLAQCARCAGVRHFVFASSCSVYGSATAGPRRETDATDPLTAYARSKIGVEEGLHQMDLGQMIVTCLRFATACGFSDRTRLDLVLNDFVACALTSKRVSVLSDGTPWRPLIDIRDMARAIEWAATRDVEAGGQLLVVNVGSNDRNHQVRDLALAVERLVPGTAIEINPIAAPDPRSYRVDFSLFNKLAPEHQPCFDLMSSISELVNGLNAIDFADCNFRKTSHTIRLNMISHLMANHQLTSDLRWSWDKLG